MKLDMTLARQRANYDLLLKALTGIYLPRVMPGQEVTPVALKQLRDEGRRLVGNFGKQLKADIQAFKQELGYETSDYDAEYEPQLTRLLHDNVATIVKALRASKADLAAMLGGGHGAVGEIIQKRITQPEFKALDTADRSWEAAKLFNFLLRNYLYYMEISATIQDIRNSGSDLARLKYPNPEHKNAGMVFSIDGKTPGHKTLAEIKASVFHYNANAEAEGVYP